MVVGIVGLFFCLSVHFVFLVLLSVFPEVVIIGTVVFVLLVATVSGGGGVYMNILINLIHT